MSFTAADVMRRASTILQDAGAVRWTAIELCDWLNEAQRVVVSIKPNALSRSVTLNLGPGTKQEIPAEYTMLSKVVRNFAGGVPGKAVRYIARRELLDSMIPGWHDPAILPYSATVGYVWQDFMSPREFYVIPGNDGSGAVEAIVGVIPTPVPIAADDPLSIESYTTVIEFGDLYQGVLLDFLLGRAFAKDSATADAAQRSQSHLQLGTQALTGITTGESNAGLAYTAAS